MFMKLALLPALAAVVVPLFLSAAAARSPHTSDQLSLPSSSLDDQFNALTLEGALIKSRADLDEYMDHANFAASPLSKLSIQTRAAFVKSLTFNERGLTGLNHRILEAELTPTEIYRTMSMFGVPHLTYLIPGAHAATALDIKILDVGAAYRANAQRRKYLSDMQCEEQGGTGCSGSDHVGYQCFSRGTCRKWNDAICTSNC